MLKIIHFIFYCFYALVPEKALFGRRNAAMIMMSVLESYIMVLSIVAFNTFVYKFLNSDFSTLIVMIFVAVVCFYFTISYFEKGERFESIVNEFKNERAIYKVIAVSLIVLVLFSFVEALDYLSEINRNTS